MRSEVKVKLQRALHRLAAGVAAAGLALTGMTLRLLDLVLRPD